MLNKKHITSVLLSSMFISALAFATEKEPPKEEWEIERENNLRLLGISPEEFESLRPIIEEEARRKQLPYEEYLTTYLIEYFKSKKAKAKPSENVQEIINNIGDIIAKPKGRDDAWPEEQLTALRDNFSTLTDPELKEQALKNWVAKQSLHVKNAYNAVVRRNHYYEYENIALQEQKKQEGQEPILYAARGNGENNLGLVKLVNSSGRDNNCLLFSIIGDDEELLARIMGDRDLAHKLMSKPEIGKTTTHFEEDVIIEQLLKLFANSQSPEANELKLNLKNLLFYQASERQELLKELDQLIAKELRNEDKAQALALKSKLVDSLKKLKEDPANLELPDSRDFQPVRRKIFDDILRALNNKNPSLSPEQVKLIRVTLDYVMLQVGYPDGPKALDVYGEFLDDLYHSYALLDYEFAFIISTLYGVNIQVYQKEAFGADKIVVEYTLSPHVLDQGVIYNPVGKAIYVYHPGIRGAHYQKLFPLGKK